MAMTPVFAWLRALLLLGCVCCPALCHAALTARDLETQALETMVADDPRAAIRTGDAWTEQALKNGDKALQLKAMRLKVMATTQLDEASSLGALAAQGLALAQAQKDPEAESEFLTARATALAGEGKYLDSLQYFDQAIVVAEKAGLARTANSVLLPKAFVYGLLGRNTDSLDLLFKAHQKFEEIGDALGVNNTLSAIGDAHAHDRSSREDLLKALTYHQRSISPDAARTRRHELSTIYFNMGVVYQRLKDFANAKIHFQKSMGIYRQLGDPVGQAFGSYRLGMLAGEAGRWQEALAFQDEALPVVSEAGDATMVFNVQRSRALALANLERRRESLDALAKAGAIRGRIDSSWIEVTYLTSAALVYARLGDFEKAFRHQVLLRDAEQKSFREAREKDAAEIQARFEVKQKEAENALLRAGERESEARRLALVLAVVLLLFVLGGLGWFLFRQGQQNRRFASLAMRDDLTGLPNRRSIVEFAHSQLRAARNDGQSLCVALVDIDHFKSVNDDCGHAVGDAVLTAFANVCSQQLRNIDRIGRYGGEEFMLIMPGSTIEQIPQVFTRLRIAVRQIRVEGMPPERHLTFSMGASAAGIADDLEKVTKRADDALYRAKEGGRDRYEVG